MEEAEQGVLYDVHCTGFEESTAYASIPGKSLFFLKLELLLGH